MTNYHEGWLFPLLFRRKGSVYYRASWFAVPGTLLSIAMAILDEYYPDLRSRSGVSMLNDGVVWGATTAILLTMIGFRTKQGYDRFWEGTGLLHTVKGEWFNTISNCVTFSVGASKTKPNEVAIFRHTIVRLMSLCHASALQDISRNTVRLEAIDTQGLDLNTLQYLESCVEEHGFNKVEALLHLIQSLISTAHSNGVLQVPPPILSRVYQTCSRGYVDLLNAKKITDTKFPFPFVQIITLLLLVHTVLTPLVLTSLTYYFAPVVSFIALLGTFSLNFIAVELEHPFGDHDNALPLADFQAEMNKCLVMLLHPGTDRVATISPWCMTDFVLLERSLKDDIVSEEFRPVLRLGRSRSSTVFRSLVEESHKLQDKFETLSSVNSADGHASSFSRCNSPILVQEFPSSRSGIGDARMDGLASLQQLRNASDSCMAQAIVRRGDPSATNTGIEGTRSDWLRQQSSSSDLRSELRYGSGRGTRLEVLKEVSLRSDMEESTSVSVKNAATKNTSQSCEDVQSSHSSSPRKTSQSYEDAQSSGASSPRNDLLHPETSPVVTIPSSSSAEIGLASSHIVCGI